MQNKRRFFYCKNLDKRKESKIELNNFNNLWIWGAAKQPTVGYGVLNNDFFTTAKPITPLSSNRHPIFLSKTTPKTTSTEQLFHIGYSIWLNRGEKKNWLKILPTHNNWIWSQFLAVLAQFDNIKKLLFSAKIVKLAYNLNLCS